MLADRDAGMDRHAKTIASLQWTVATSQAASEHWRSHADKRDKELATARAAADAAIAERDAARQVAAAHAATVADLAAEKAKLKAILADLRSVVTPPLEVAKQSAALRAGDVAVVRDSRGDRDRLGSGAQGDVYAATLRCAMKVPRLPHGGAAHTDATVSAFWQEVAFHQPLCHPHIVAVHGGCAVVDTTSGRTTELQMVMEVCSGGTLELRLHGAGAGTIPRRQRLTWALQTMSALAYLHARDIIHADVKPENVLLEDASPSARAKLSDLGMSKHRADTTVTAVTDSLLGLRGSFLYMDDRLLVRHVSESTSVVGGTGAAGGAGAPGRSGAGSADSGSLRKVSDVYSAGVMLWECATGRKPYVDVLGGGVLKRVTLMALVDFVVAGGRPATPKELAVLAPAGLGALIMRMWSGKAEERPTMAAAVEELRRLVADLK